VALVVPAEGYETNAGGDEDEKADEYLAHGRVVRFQAARAASVNR
jgi:hypothetical protein